MQRCIQNARQASRIELLKKQQKLSAVNYFAKGSILDVWLGFQHASEV